MRERANEIGAKLRVESKTGKGTRIVIAVPITDAISAAANAVAVETIS